MGLKISSKKLIEIMKAFYQLSGIKIVIFDEVGNEVCSYPEGDCTFCRLLKGAPETSGKCESCDMHSFKESKRAGGLKIYTCYAGLVEGCAPLKQQDKIIGYIMFGQVSDFLNRKALLQNVEELCRQFSLPRARFVSAAKDISLKSYEEIMAAAKIFEACVSYIILNDMLHGAEDRVIVESEKYVEDHISDVSVDSLCRHLGISRTALYKEFSEKCSEGVSSFIKRKQFERSRSLLEKTDKSIMQISRMCGFGDYNYFSRIFKQRYGVSPRDYRKISLAKSQTKGTGSDV